VELAGSTNDVNLASNRVEAAGGDGGRIVYYTGSATSADQFSEASLEAAPVNYGWGPAVRCGSDGFSCYFADQFNPGHMKWVAGSLSFIGSVTSPHADDPGEVARCEVEGTTITSKVEGVTVTNSPVTDSSLTTAGNGAGLFFGTNGVAVDNWAGGDIGGAPPPPPPTLRVLTTNQRW
jgi:hypothetical protein